MSLVRTEALEWGSLGIRVNAVAPGTIRTPKSLQGNPHPAPRYSCRASEAIPLERRGSGDDIAGAVLFLLSDLARLGHGAGAGRSTAAPRRARRSWVRQPAGLRARQLHFVDATDRRARTREPISLPAAPVRGAADPLAPRSAAGPRRVTLGAAGRRERRRFGTGHRAAHGCSERARPGGPGGLGAGHRAPPPPPIPLMDQAEAQWEAEAAEPLREAVACFQASCRDAPWPTAR